MLPSKLTNNWGTPYIYVWIPYYIYMMLINIVIPVGSAFGVIFSIFIFIMAVHYGYIYNSFKGYFTHIFLYLAFVFFVILINSSNYLVSYKSWVKLSIGLLSLPIGFSIFDNEENVKRIWKVFFVILHLYILNAIVANIFHLGGGYYGKGSDVYETGNLFAAALYANVYIITMIPVFIRYNMNKIYLLTIAGICAVLVIVNMKRTPILCGLISVVAFILVLQYLNKKYGRIASTAYFKYVFLFVVIFSSSFLYFQNKIKQQIKAREEKLELAELRQEGRVLEFQYIVEENILSGDIVKFLIGKETFNTEGNYAGGRFKGRGIHQDYSLLLHGTGIIGFLWYLYMHIFMLLLPLKKKYSSLFFDNNDNRLLLAIYVSFNIIHFVSMLSGTTQELFASIVFYLVAGMILRCFYEQLNDNFLFQSDDI